MQRLVSRITLYKELHKIHLLAPELRHLADLQPMQKASQQQTHEE